MDSDLESTFDIGSQLEAAGNRPTPSPQAQPVPSATPDDPIFAQAKKQFPILNNPNLVFKRTPRPETNFNYLETWPPGEGGGSDYPRPKDIPMDKYGVEVYKNSTTPLMVIGDAVSHMLRFTDPTVKKYYGDFQNSLTDSQKAMLQRQYQYEVKYNHEKRPYQEWESVSGLPQYFGGYAFKEWPNAQQYYTPEQLKQFDAMMQYLQGPTRQ